LGDLDRMFNPKSIAVIGASRNPKKIGYELVSNILAGGYEGRLYPVNTEGAEIMGMKSYTSIMEGAGGRVDLGCNRRASGFTSQTSWRSAAKRA